MKQEKAVKKIVFECWIRSDPTKIKYRQRLKKIWDEIGVFLVTEQKLADQARQIRTNKWLTDMEIKEIKRKLEQKNSKAEVQENVQEITEHNENKQDQVEERGVQEILVGQGEMPNWKIPGPDGVQQYQIKNLSNLHKSIALQLDRCLQENNLSKWMVTGKTLLCIKEIQKGNLVSNFRTKGMQERKPRHKGSTTD